MRRHTIDIPVTLDVDELAGMMAQKLSNESTLKLFKDVDALVGDWGFTEKVYKHFKAEMNILAVEEGKPKEQSMPEPWLDAEIGRLWANSPELHKDVKSLAAFQRIVKHIECAKGIRQE